MAGFGEKLRRQRELRGISLDQIATATKISTRMLKAIEDEKFDLLPGGIFNKGFIRAYAKFLGLDEEQTVADYVAATGPEEPINNIPQIADLPDRATRQLDEDATISWNAIVVLVLIMVLGYGGWWFYNHRKVERESRAASAPVSVPAATPVETPMAAAKTAPPAGSTGNTSKSVAPQTNSKSVAVQNSSSTTPPASQAALKTDSTAPAMKPAVDLVIRTSEETWVQAVADGKTVFSETLPAASEKHVTAARRITLTVGNAGGVEITYNGATLPDVGGPGKVRTIVFSPNKFEFQSEDQ